MKTLFKPIRDSIMPSLESNVKPSTNLWSSILQVYKDARSNNGNSSFIRRLAIAYIIEKYQVSTVKDINSRLNTDDELSSEHVKHTATKHMVKSTAARVSALKDNVSSFEDPLDEAELNAEVLYFLSDAKKSGSPLRDALLPIKVLTVVLTKPVPQGYGTSWTLNMLSHIFGRSISTIFRILKDYGVSPNKTESRCFSNDPNFLEKAQRIVSLYGLAASGEAIVYAFDEKACEVHDQEFQWSMSQSGCLCKGLSSTYERNGVTNMLTAISINNSRVYNEFFDKKTSVEARAFFERFADKALQDNAEYLAQNPEAKIYVVMDNFRTHSSDKGIAGLLNDSKYARFELVFTPTHSSWLNLCEGFFGNVAKRVLKHGRYDCKSKLHQDVNSFIDVWNQNTPAAIVWRAVELFDNQIKWTDSNLDPFMSKRANPKLKQIKDDIQKFMTSEELQEKIDQAFPVSKEEVADADEKEEEQLQAEELKEESEKLELNIEQAKADLEKIEDLYNSQLSRVAAYKSKAAKYKEKEKSKPSSRILRSIEKLEALIKCAQKRLKKKELNCHLARSKLAALEHRKLCVMDDISILQA